MTMASVSAEFAAPHPTASSPHPWLGLALCGSPVGTLLVLVWPNSSNNSSNNNNISSGNGNAVLNQQEAVGVALVCGRQWCWWCGPILPHCIRSHIRDGSSGVLLPKPIRPT
jgi:hypothetical protein